ncbi:hypothetical protein RW092_20555 [Paenibacillus sp. 3LSP]|uniref:hypothetical protein n=1 Tax=Paenibacillus sp. 3LSP TaxID=2800795 RepID=UPI0028FD1403|nr:hypothetical protein [Paenibacillus sp. 3LSP]MDU0332566.1 hypothetical protein [Paenibacillus sp. 3LSP]
MAVPQQSEHTHNPGRDAAMTKGRSKIPIDPVIVKTYKIGGSTVHIGSNFFAKTPEEKERVLRDFHEAGWKIVRKIQEQGGSI